MIRRFIRRGFKLALIVGTALAVFKVVQSRRPNGNGNGRPFGGGATAPPIPSPPRETERLKPAARETATKTEVAAQLFVEPADDGSCPAGYPVKAKMSSGIYHLPGMLAYDRTHPDRCYRDEAGAEADGLRKAKR